MSNNEHSFYNHPLSRDGMSRLDSENTALSPQSVQLDGRDMSGLLRFVYEYARQINHYEESSAERAGDWQPFFRESVPFQYAIIGGYDLEQPERRLQRIEDTIISSLDYSSLDLLFDLIFDLAAQLEQWLSALRADDSGLQAAIKSLIDTNLREQYLQLIHLANAAGQWGYRRSKNAHALQQYWGIRPMEVYTVDTTLLTMRGSNRHKILAAKDLLKERYRIFWKGIEAIVLLARDQSQLERSLEGESSGKITPHLGLLFAFLKLFQGVQKQGINGLAERQLRFFYRSVLGLREQASVPDSAYLTFALAKQAPSAVLLTADTAFLAGKGDDGQDILFRLEEELIVTRAKVAGLKTLFLQPGENVPVQGLYAAPMANSADGRGENDFDKEQLPLWATVGAAQSKWLNPDTQVFAPQPQAKLGFLLASKVLFLREGKRTVTVRLSLKQEGEYALDDQDFLRLELSTEEGWLPVPVPPVFSLLEENPDEKYITLTFTLDESFPAVLYPGQEALGFDYGHRLPMLRFWFDPNRADLYGTIRDWQVCDVNISVTVCGLRQLVVQNDLAVLDINKPFMPFGPMPKANSSNFYIGSEEVFCKRWDKIGVNVVWKDLPQPSFRDYYEAYDNRPESNDDFVAGVSVLSEGGWLSENGEEIKLFAANNENDSNCPALTDGYRSVVQRSDFGEPVPCQTGGLENGYTVNTRCGFLRLRLGGRDFYHDKYANLLTARMLEIANFSEDPSTVAALAATNKFRFLNISNFQPAINAANEAAAAASTTKTATNNAYVYSVNYLSPPSYNSLATLRTLTRIANERADESESAADIVPERIQNITAGGQEVILPNPPYTPLIESLSIDYTATAQAENGEVAFTHLYPYEAEGNHLAFADLEHCPTIIPCFADEGTLFIGLEGLQPGEGLSLLFRLEPSTADPDRDKAPVCWEYLRNNTWKPLRKDLEVLQDGTNGLLQTGIVKIAVPTDISHKETTILPRHLHWIKARVPYRTAAISEALSVQAQAGRVRFDLGSSNPARLEKELGAESIAKFAAPVPGIKDILQPDMGFGGKPAEPASHFYQRVSRHLRHKGRAISLYDYENLVLEQFPEIYKVKCITHTLGRRSPDSKACDIERAPGHVTIVAVPDLERLKAKDPLQPQLPAALLLEVQRYLQERSSPFIRIHVLNPLYQAISVKSQVRFRAGRSVNFYLQQLEKDVQAFLAPWAFAEQRQDISFGGQIYYSMVLKFIEDRDYVDYVSDFALLDTSQNNAEEQKRIKARTSRSILTSAATHDFTAIAGEDATLDEQNLQRQGIGAIIINR